MSENTKNEPNQQDPNANQNADSNSTQPFKYDPAFNEARKYTKLFVGGLPFSSTDAALHNYFSKFGEILEAVVIKDRLTDQSKGYGFVTMKDIPSAEKAIRNPRPIIDGRRCNVNYAFIGAKKKLMEPTWPMETEKFDQCYFQYISPNSSTITYSDTNYNVGFPMYQNISEFYRYGFIPYCVMYQQEMYNKQNMINIDPNVNANMNMPIPHMIPPQFPYPCAYTPGPSFGCFYFTPDARVVKDCALPETTTNDEISPDLLNDLKEISISSKKSKNRKTPDQSAKKTP